MKTRLLLRGTPLGEIRAVLFDKDGTLSHSEPGLLTLASARVFHCLEEVDPALRAELRNLLERAYGLRAGCIHPAGTTAVASRAHNLISTATALAQVGLGWPEAQAIAEEVFRRTDAHDAQRGTTTDGLRPLLERLHGEGLICAVISNDDRSGIANFLRLHGLEPFFQGIWSAEHRPRKPDPAAVHGLCAELGIATSDCALVGDANSDLRMAVAAGIAEQCALGYTAGWSMTPPLAEGHPLIHHWSELDVQAGRDRRLCGPEEPRGPGGTELSAGQG